MKKWLVGFVVILLVAAIASFVFIPGVIRFSKIEKIAVHSEEALRHFTENGLRQKWVRQLEGSLDKDNKNAAGNLFIFKKDSFVVSVLNAPALQIAVGNNEEKINSQLLMVAEGVDSTVIIWEGEIHAGNNPISRGWNYMKARRIKNQFTEILQSFNSFISVTANVYSFPIETTKVQDTILVTQRKMFTTYPTTQQIYEMVARLESYAKANGAALTNVPMLNITVLDNTQFQCTVAIPINKAIVKDADVYISKMVPGKILVQTINGGPATIGYAYRRLLDYFRQHKHISPALSFESLVTDRSKVTDTAKWVTKIYYPIF